MSDASDFHDIHEIVRRRYAAAATLASAGEHGQDRALEASSCCGVTVPGMIDEDGRTVFGADLYSAATTDGANEAAVAASLGCGVPTAVADLHPGETVLDLGSGAVADGLIPARRVGPAGKAIGLDMTAEMLDLARRNAADSGVGNVEFVQGDLEDIPLPDASVDVVLSNCVINLAADKHLVLSEAARVLRPGGRFAVSDVIADPNMDDATRADMAAWTGCIAGALTAEQYQAALVAAGLINVEITETHRVHGHAAGALIHARKPADTVG
ncbi:MAG: arsenite methyltransferase [Acidimicrobiales bacterium]